MTTLVELHASARTVPSSDSTFFFWLSAICFGIVIVGFAPTYWLQIAMGTGRFPAIIHVHAVSAAAWLALLTGQSWFIVQGRLDRHRTWGLIGLALATFLVTVGVIAAISMLKMQLARSNSDNDRAFEIVILSQLVGFSGFFIAAMANMRRPDWHRRFMLCAALQLASVGIARMFFFAWRGMHPGLWPGVIPHPPVSAHIPVTLLLGAIILFAMVRDRRADGRVHPAWKWGMLVTLGIGFLRIPIARTSEWFAVVNWLVSL